MTAALQGELFRKIRPFAQLRNTKGLHGVGMSDSVVYSHILEEKFSYLNTFFHAKPRLSILNPPLGFRNRFDFV